MITFWLCAGLLCVAALAFVLVPLLGTARKQRDTHRLSVNVSLYRERVRELRMQHGRGTLDAARFEAGRVEAARDLLDDTQDPRPVMEAPLGRAVPLLMALSVPLLALLLYMHWGSPTPRAMARQPAGEAARHVALPEPLTGRAEIVVHPASGRASTEPKAVEKAPL
ncbi:c-type cytochrome biogenesis protein CcmI [Cupriavidus nantongensis]|uniref:C-type cytochrome biogenesis protein CcmI n=1 Tax=Cupriavidus nantongensis TaxID=1796606 RepID=A0A142JKA6_9BURK|nr:c-type cytochrome biogenesis protein CcmI [Cupriavidus nantongensis]AMR78518.1 hypothetical protein A2G96_12650 [Cupriavidus nantongensis]